MDRGVQVKTNLSAAGVAFGLTIAIAVCAWVITMRSSYGAEAIPPQYDKPYRGLLFEEIAATDEELAEHCGPARPGFYKHGCAIVRLDYCIVYMLPEETLRARGVSLREVLRHEIAHCLGWHHGPAKLTEEEKR
jgi:hypothetical protein